MAIKCSKCGFVNEDGSNFCNKCGYHLSIDHNDQSPKSDLEWFAQSIYDGNVNLPTENCPIILKKNEEALIVLPNITLKEPRSVRTSLGGYAGPTIRITKGFSIKLGGVSSRSISHEEIKIIDKGTLTITNKRLIFTGLVKTLNYNLNKILSINEFNDGISIQRENKQKPEYFIGTDKLHLNYSRNNNVNNTPFYGSFLKVLIMSQLQ